MTEVAAKSKVFAFSYPLFCGAKAGRVLLQSSAAERAGSLLFGVFLAIFAIYRRVMSPPIQIVGALSGEKLWAVVMAIFSQVSANVFRVFLSPFHYLTFRFFRVIAVVRLRLLDQFRLVFLVPFTARIDAAFLAFSTNTVFARGVFVKVG